MKRSPKRRSPSKKRSSPSKKRRSPKRRSPLTKRSYRMNGNFSIKIQNMAGNYIEHNGSILFNVDNTTTFDHLKHLVDEVMPPQPDHFNRFFIRRIDGMIVAKAGQLVSQFIREIVEDDNTIHCVQAVKSFAVLANFLGQRIHRRGLLRSFETKEEALKAAWNESKQMIIEIKNNPIPPYQTSRYLNLDNVDLSVEPVIHTEDDLTQSIANISQMFANTLSFRLIRVEA